MTMDWNKAGALVAGAQRIVVLTHVGPDGDAIGSMLVWSTRCRSRVRP